MQGIAKLSHLIFQNWRRGVGKAEEGLHNPTLKTNARSSRFTEASRLSQATLEQKRQLLELLVDRVVVTKEEVEIRSVIPTSPKSEKIRFCQLRSDYFHVPSVLGMTFRTFAVVADWV